MKKTKKGLHETSAGTSSAARSRSRSHCDEQVRETIARTGDEQVRETDAVPEADAEARETKQKLNAETGERKWGAMKASGGEIT